MSRGASLSVPLKLLLTVASPVPLKVAGRCAVPVPELEKQITVILDKITETAEMVLDSEQRHSS